MLVNGQLVKVQRTRRMKHESGRLQIADAVASQTRNLKDEGLGIEDESSGPDEWRTQNTRQSWLQIGRYREKDGGKGHIK
jgi:hypothetical protein